MPMLEKRAWIKKRESTFRPAILPTHANTSGR